MSRSSGRYPGSRQYYSPEKEIAGAQCGLEEVRQLVGEGWSVAADIRAIAASSYGEHPPYIADALSNGPEESQTRTNGSGMLLQNFARPRFEHTCLLGPLAFRANSEPVHYWRVAAVQSAHAAARTWSQA